MIASDGLTIGTALAQLNNLKREFDALEAATSRARHQLDRMLEQFDCDEFDRPDRDDDAQAAASNFVAAIANPEDEHGAGHPTNTAAMAIEKTFNDDVDSLFDAELIVDDVLGGRRFDDDELSAEGDDICASLSAAFEDADEDRAIIPAATERHEDDACNSTRSAVDLDEESDVVANERDREIRLEPQDGDDETVRLIACLSVCETDDHEAVCEISDTGSEAGAVNLPDHGSSALDAIMAVASTNVPNDDDHAIMASSMHQPIMEFSGTQLDCAPQPEDAAIFDIMDEADLSDTIESDSETDVLSDSLIDSADDGEFDAARETGPEAEVEIVALVIDDSDDGEQTDPTTDVALSATDTAVNAEGAPDEALADVDAPEMTVAETAEDSARDGADEVTDRGAADHSDNIIALTKPTQDDFVPPRRRGGLATALIGASAIAAALAIAPQFVPMDSLQHLPPVQDLLHQLSQIKYFLA